QIPHSFRSELPRKMADEKSNPVAIGTKGTVASLIMQEIDYFSRLELGGRVTSNEPSCQRTDTGAKDEAYSTPTISVSKRKRRGRKRCIPSMCSVVEVAESSQGFTYKNLKTDVKRLQP
ncbi:hypothetical protein ABTP16_20230, partial [Acinetobacter baumannii]